MRHLLSVLIEVEGLLDAPAASAHVTAQLAQSEHVTLVEITACKPVTHSPEPLRGREMGGYFNDALESQRIAGTV